MANQAIGIDIGSHAIKIAVLERKGATTRALRLFRAVVAGDTDPWWARSWSLDNLRQRGGLRPLAEVLAFDIDPAEREDGQKLLLEAGLVVSFLVDGECAPVREAHAELKRALVGGRVHASDVEALTEALLANESELRAFSDL